MVLLVMIWNQLLLDDIMEEKIKEIIMINQLLLEDIMEEVDDVVIIRINGGDCSEWALHGVLIKDYDDGILAPDGALHGVLIKGCYNGIGEWN